MLSLSLYFISCLLLALYPLDNKRNLKMSLLHFKLTEKKVEDECGENARKMRREEWG